MLSRLFDTSIGFHGVIVASQALHLLYKKDLAVFILKSFIFFIPSDCVIEQPCYHFMTFFYPSTSDKFCKRSRIGPPPLAE
jgi:hypothetical protein